MLKIGLKALDSLGFNTLIRRLRAVVAPVLGASLLMGCQIGTKIEVRTINGTTVFVVLREDGQSACVQSINVSEGRGEAGRASKWSLIQNYADVQSGKNSCNNVFIYGSPIKGYEQEYDGKPLEPAKTYYVSIGGGGLTGDKTFTAER